MNDAIIARIFAAFAARPCLCSRPVKQPGGPE